MIDTGLTRDERPPTPVNAYGEFDPETHSFVIRDPLTPRPWVNVLANDRYGLVISQKGGGFSWLDNCQLWRLTRWDQDLASDAQGRFLYVLDEDTGMLASTTYQPVRRRPERERVVHGLGFTTFVREFVDLHLEHTVFVPRHEACELWLVTVTNASDRPRRLRVASYLEWHFGGPGEWHREFHRLFMESEAEGNRLVAWKHPALTEGSREGEGEPKAGVVAWSGVEKVAWMTDKPSFLGRGGELGDPEGLRNPPQASSSARWDDPVAVGMAALELGPGESKTILLTLGAADSVGLAKALADKFDAGSARTELAATCEAWRSRCAQASVETPDAAFDAMNNAWLPYQAVAGRMIARCAYYQQGGAYGHRDQLQDSLMLLASEPESTLAQLGRNAEAMYTDGAVRHWWHPNTDIGVDSHHSDTCLWLSYGTLAYLDETANLDALQASYRYLDRGAGSPSCSGSLMDHCVRGMRRAMGRLSPRGLPLIGAGDWNDGLSHAGIEGRGESVWLAMFLFHILQRWRPYLEDLGESGMAQEFCESAESLRQAVEAHAWDGAWYIGGTRDDGQPFGSSECREGRLFLNPQTWAVISGIGSPARRALAMDSVRRDLIKPYGALLLTPAYSSVDPYIGYITRYAPGLRENGGVYSHASTWAVQALAMEGRDDEAFDLYRGMLPSVRSAEDPDLYAAEPYVMPGNSDGPDSPFESRAGWTWYTGSAAWMRRIAHEWILGVRPSRHGLIVDPHLPASWNRASLVRTFRGSRVRVEIERGEASSVTVDGEPASFPLCAEPGDVNRVIRVVLGP